METPIVAITGWVQQEVIDRLEPSCRVIANRDREPWPDDVLRGHVASADVLIAFMPDRMDEAALARAPRLRMISCCLKGHDNFDIDACSRRGVLVSVLPDLLTAPGAELAIGLMIAAGRQVVAADAYVRRGEFRGWRPRFYGTGLADSAIGILGLGAVGRSIAERLRPFGARVLYWDRSRAGDEAERRLGVSYRDLDPLLASCDFVVLALALTADTRHLIDAHRLARMKPGAILVNFARGSLVDEAAVAASLQAERLGFYAADVFEFEDWGMPERPSRIHPDLLALGDRTLFTPHLGSAVRRVREAMAMQAAENVLTFLAGGTPAGALNADRVASADRDGML